MSALLWIANSQILCLSVLATAYQPFMPLQKQLSFQVGVQWHFEAEELVYPAVVYGHIFCTRLIQAATTTA